MLDGKLYKREDLHLLPEKYKLKSLFTPSCKGITAFFTRNSLLSNDCTCQFKLEGERYNCMEQYLMSAKAAFFNDQQSVVNICKAQDPVQQKHLGGKIMNFRQDTWSAEVEKILFKGLCAKFEQNPSLAKFLINTKESVIAEANPYDSVFGVGFSLGHPDLWQKDRWQGSNIQGNALEKVCSMLQGK